MILALNYTKQEKALLKVGRLLDDNNLTNRKALSLIKQFGIIEQRVINLDAKLANVQWENAVRQEAASRHLGRTLAKHLSPMKQFYWKKGLNREKARAMRNYALLTGAPTAPSPRRSVRAARPTRTPTPPARRLSPNEAYERRRALGIVGAPRVPGPRHVAETWARNGRGRITVLPRRATPRKTH
jgi:hypothetical protein